jgi:preprotein translocase subunit SecA
MASYKKLAEDRAKEMAARIVSHQKEMDSLRSQVANMADLDQMLESVTDDEAKAVFATFAERAQNRAELILLIRVLARINHV